MKILDLGCGRDRVKDAVTLDINNDFKPDVVHDLNKFPYPFEDKSFNKIYLNNILFHLEDIFKVLGELHRILDTNGEIIVTSAYFRSPYAFYYPNPKNLFTVKTFDFFDPDNFFFKTYKYTRTKFKLKKIIFNENFKNGFIKNLIKFFANRFPNYYENNISHIFPLDEIKYYLKKVD